MVKAPQTESKEIVKESAQSEIQNPCCSTGMCHCHSAHFWLWTTLRVLILLALVIGAFIFGVRVGIKSLGGFDNYRDDYGRHGGMMMQGDYRNNRMIPTNVVVPQRNTAIVVTNTGSTPISNTGSKTIKPTNTSTGAKAPIR